MPEPSELDPLARLNHEILFGALDAIDGSKVIVWDPPLIKRFNLIARTEQLKQHGVVSMLQLELMLPGIPQVEHNHVVYVLSSASSSIKKLCACLAHAKATQDRRLHHALVVPDATFVVRDMLKQQSGASLKSIQSLPIRLFPLYDDLITMLMNDIHTKLLLNNDWTELQRCASAIRQLESLALSLPNLRCKGKWAAQVVEIVKKLRTQDESGSHFASNEWNISDIVIIDRWIDPLTPLLLQLTYAGLIDELFDMGATGNIKASPINEQGTSNASAEIALHDDLFHKLRDLHIKDVGRNIAKTLNSLREERNTLKENRPSDSLAESKVLVRKLLDMQGSERHADVHTQIAGRIMSSIRDNTRLSKFPLLAIDILKGEFGDKVIPQLEDLMIEGYDPLMIVRFIALQCLVCGGLKNATFAAYQRQFIQCDYAPFDFQQTTRRLACFTEEIEPDYDSMAYAYNGYVPPLIRHVELGVQNGWREWTSVLGEQQSSGGTTVIVVIGGLTLSELSIFEKIQMATKPVIVTTALITAKRVLQAALDS